MSLRSLVTPRALDVAAASRSRPRRRASPLLWALLGALLVACGNEQGPEQTTESVVWRCTQTPSLSLTSASCACTSFAPGDDAAWVGTEVTVCDASLVCCFIGPSPAGTPATALGIEECRCVKAASCEAEKAARPGVRDAGGMCPPAAT